MQKHVQGASVCDGAMLAGTSAAALVQCQGWTELICGIDLDADVHVWLCDLPTLTLQPMQQQGPNHRKQSQE